MIVPEVTNEGLGYLLIQESRLLVGGLSKFHVLFLQGCLLETLMFSSDRDVY